jgi:hydrogenase expression/formation protein HypC
MCIGIPMQVLPGGAGALVAWCDGRNGREQLDMLLVGAQPVGTWVLAFQGAARRVLDAQEAAGIDRALDALGGALAGDEGSIDLAAFFPDLIGREPQLPEHLRTTQK